MCLSVTTQNGQRERGFLGIRVQGQWTGKIRRFLQYDSSMSFFWDLLSLILSWNETLTYAYIHTYAYKTQTHTPKHYVVYQRALKASWCLSPLLGNCPIMCWWWMEPLQMFYDRAIFILSSQWGTDLWREAVFHSGVKNPHHHIP